MIIAKDATAHADIAESGEGRDMKEIKLTLWDRIKMKLRRIGWRDIAARCAKTFVQAAVGVLSTVQFTDIANATDKGAVICAVVVAAVAAGASAVWNLILDIVKKEADFNAVG